MPGLIHEPKVTEARIGFLANLPLYKTTKPTIVVPPAQYSKELGVNPPNVKMGFADNVPVTSVRGWEDKLSLDEQGFQVIELGSKFDALDTPEVCAAYKQENQRVLEETLGAEKVITWGIKQRTPHQREAGAKWEYWNEVEVEKPALIVHCDFTWERGLEKVGQVMGKEELQKYIDQGYRVRVINTWRPLIDVIERQPLALCDPRSVKPEHLVKCDRVLVDDLGEITMLQHDPEQKWYWLEDMKKNEAYIFCTWDSNDINFPADVPRHCPHGAIAPVNVREDAPPRFSVESRSVVITKN